MPPFRFTPLPVVGQVYHVGILQKWLHYVHPAKEIVNSSRDAEIVTMYEMESNEEVWADWLNQENEIAVNDRKTMGAGGGKYLSFIAFVLKKNN